MTADTTSQRGPSPQRSTRALRLGQVFGVPVYLNFSYLILAAIIVFWYQPVARLMVPQLSSAEAYLLSVGLVFFLFVSVLLHELGHALMARGFGMGVRAITIELLGGYTEMESDSPNARADLFVSLIGPVVSAALGVAALGLRGVVADNPVLNQLAFQLAWSNLVVAVFNALPGLPLDGGRVLRAAVWGLTGRRHTGTYVAGWIGRLIAVGTVAAATLLYSAGRLTFVSVIFALLVGSTLWQGASAAIGHGRLAARLPRVDLRRLARPVFLVMSGTPLAEAQRRAADTLGAGAVLGVADSAGRLVALVHDEAASAVPLPRRPWVPVESVARTLEPGRTLAVDLTGEDVIRAVQANPASSYLIVSGDDVVGVLRMTDLARLLNA